MADLTGKTALITGATGGIGRAIARSFVDAGANVVLADLADAATLDAMVAEFPDRAVCALCDVTDEAAMARAVDVGLARFGRIDIGVLNAGIEGPFGMLGSVKLADFDKVMAVNVRGVFIGLQALMPVMQRQKGGAITILSSTAGRRGSRGLTPYITSKHAVVGMMKCAALEGAADGIRVNTVNPGPIETRMMRAIESNASPADPAQLKDALLTAIPMGRYGKAGEVAELITFLSSERASYCTGNIYGVDGGLTAG